MLCGDFRHPFNHNIYAALVGANFFGSLRIFNYCDFDCFCSCDLKGLSKLANLMYENTN